MKLRTRLILSYLIVVSIVAVGMLLLGGGSVSRMARRNLSAVEGGIEEVADANLHLSEKVLTQYGERLVEQQGLFVAENLASLLRGRDLKDYAALRTDPVLRKAATPDMLTIDETRAGYCDLLDRTGLAVLHPNPDVEGKNFADWKDKYPRMWDMVAEAIADRSGNIVRGYYSFLDRDSRSRQKYMTILPVRGTDFLVCAVVNIDDYFLPIHEKIIAASDSASQNARDSILETARISRRHFRHGSLISCAVLVLLTGAFGWYLAGTVAKPILELHEGVQRIGQGDFAISIRENGIPEVVELKRCVNRLGGQLTEYMNNLEREVRARQVVESELDVAGNIQKSLLPHIFPPFPERKEFDLHARNRPARRVGGDFYDFFFRADDPDTLVILIADVSGKGVPASLFMAVTGTIMRIVCTEHDSPAAALREANQQLCNNTETGMFVTLFLAYYHTDTGRCEFANAGHNPPYRIGADGTIHPITSAGGLILGVQSDWDYPQGQFDLQPDETFFLFTDGVTEATSPQPARELFGEQRLEELLGERIQQGDSPAALCETIARTVMEFQHGDPFDDITVLAWKRNL